MLKDLFIFNLGWLSKENVVFLKIGFSLDYNNRRSFVIQIRLGNNDNYRQYLAHQLFYSVLGKSGFWI